MKRKVVIDVHAQAMSPSDGSDVERRVLDSRATKLVYNVCPSQICATLQHCQSREPKIYGAGFWQILPCMLKQ